jgi:WD40 repeat protein
MAQAWIYSGKSERQLLEGQPLQEALASNWHGLGPLVEEFLTASQAAHHAKEAALQAEKEAQHQHELGQARALAEAERQRAEAQAKAARRLRWVVVALGLVILTMVGLAGTAVYAFIQRQEVLISHEVITTSLALDGRYYIAVAPNGTTVKLVDTANQQLLLSLIGHTAEVTKINLSPNNALLATSDRSGTTIIWDLRQQGRLIQRLNGHTDTIRYVVFSHDGRLLATGGDDGTTRVWDTSTWEQTFVLKSGSGSIISVAFWDDDTWLVTATTAGVYTIWDPWTGEKLFSCQVGQLTLDCQ